jgi:hypothetical protein
MFRLRACGHAAISRFSLIAGLPGKKDDTREA